MHNVKNCLEYAWYVKLSLTYHSIVKRSLEYQPRALAFFLLRGNRLSYRLLSHCFSRLD